MMQTSQYSSYSSSKDSLIRRGSSAIELTLEELRHQLEKERALNRKQAEDLKHAKELLWKQGIHFETKDEVGHIPEVHNLSSIRRPSVIKEAFMEHFMAMSNMMRQSKTTSDTYVRVSNLSLKIKKCQSSKPFPTVGETLLGPFAQLCAKRSNVNSKNKADSSNKKPKQLTVLQDVSAVMEPGKTYLLLGPPTSGKSTLLKAIAGQLSIPSGGSLTGDITYNNDKADSKRFHITSVATFVEQLDTHEPFLTVRETLEFAGCCKFPIIEKQFVETPFGQAMIDVIDLDEGTKEKLRQGKFLQLSKVRTAFAKHRTEMILTLLGLKQCADTIVGNEKIRGISGGERRRVTLGEMIMGCFSVLCADEISTGLDSAATYDIIRMITAATKAFKYTAIVSLLQPPPEVFALFDEVLLMREGRVIFQGPTDEIIGYYASLGYPCPENKDPADFFVEVHSTGGEMYLQPPSPPSSSISPPPPVPPRTALEFQTHYRECSPYWSKHRQPLLETPRQKAGSHGWKTSELLGYTNHWWFSFILCLHREWLFFIRDRAFLLAKLVQNIILGIILGTIYFGIAKDDFMDRYGAAYSMLGTIGLNSLAVIPLNFDHRAVYYKQHHSQFYHPSAYAFANTLVSSLHVIIDTLTFGAIFYFLAAFSTADNGRPFFLACAILIAGSVAMQQFFRTISFLVPDQKAALSLVGSGYITTRDNTPVYWSWCLYMNPFFYMFQGMAVNEFRSSRYGTEGIAYLKNLGLYSNPFWAWLSIIAGLIITVVYWLIGLVAMKYVEHHLQSNSTEDEEEEELEPVVNMNNGGGGGGVVDGRPVLPLSMEMVMRSPDMNAGSGVFSTQENPEGFIAVDVADHHSNNNNTSSSNVREEQQQVPTTALVFGTTSTTTSSNGIIPSLQVHPPSTTASINRLTPSAPPITTTNNINTSYNRSGSHHSLAFTPMTLAFRRLTYSVTLPATGESVDLLKEVDGYFKPGTMTALMGSSGAGKTTLLDVIAGRKTSGTIKGDLYVNGAPIDMKTYSRVIGYVEQMDLHTPLTTVYEALEFSARLRLSATIPKAAQDKFLEEVIDLLELRSIQDDIVGQKGAGLSTEQRKRLTIGVELVANPSLIFLDEPTSGLDSRAALVVIRVVKKLALTGRTIICTIHQPSLALFQHFDDLLLLKRGGETVFFGPLGYNSYNLIDYLQSIPGTPHFVPGENPATWMLGCIGAGTGGSEKCDYATEYKNSTLHAICNEELEGLIPRNQDDDTKLLRDLERGSNSNITNHQNSSSHNSASPAGSSSSAVTITAAAATAAAAKAEKAKILPKGQQQGIITSPSKLRKIEAPVPASWFTAAKMCIRRSVISYWRMPSYNFVRPVLCLFIGLVFASVFGPQDQTDFKGLYGFIAVMFLATNFIGKIDCTPVIDVLTEEKPSFARERFTNMYPVSAYAISWPIAEIPWIMLHSCLFAAPFYFLCGYYQDAAKFFYFLLFHFLFNLWNSYYGQFLAVISPTAQVAQLLNNFIGTLLMNFMGFTRNPKNIPIYWKFLYWALPAHYTLEGMVTTQWHDSTSTTIYTFPSGASVPVPTSTLINIIFANQFKYSNRWINVGVLVGFSFVMILGLWAGYRFCRMGSR